MMKRSIVENISGVISVGLFAIDKKALVASGYNLHIFQAVIFPLPVKNDVVSQAVIE